MRARLLDMGDVGAVRSQSLYHAVAAAAGQEDDPAIVLSSPKSSCVSVGLDQDPERAVDLDFCRRSELAVLGRPTGGGSTVLDSSHLLVCLVIPVARAESLGLAGAKGARLARLATVPVAAYRALGVEAVFVIDEVRSGDRRLGRTGVGEIGGCFCFLHFTPFDYDYALAAQALSGETEAGIRERETTLYREMGAVPRPAVVAEALVEAAESILGFELVPSMPTPDELEAIFDWDRRLVDGEHRIEYEGVASHG